MAGRARGLAETGIAACVVEMLAPDFDGSRRRVEERNVRHDMERGGVEYRKGGRESVQHVEPLTRFVEGESRRAFTEFNGRGVDSLAVRVNQDKVARAHSGDIAARAGAVPDNAARVAQGKVAHALRNAGGRVVEMRVETDDGLRQRDWFDERQGHAEKRAAQVRIKAAYVRDIRADDRDPSVRRIHRHVHAKVHQTGG